MSEIRIRSRTPIFLLNYPPDEFTGATNDRRNGLGMDKAGPARIDHALVDGVRWYLGRLCLPPRRAQMLLPLVVLYACLERAPPALACCERILDEGAMRTPAA